MGLTCEADDVRSSFLDLAESFCGSRNSLVDNNSLHLRIIRKVDDCLDCCLELFCEVVGVDSELNHVLSVKSLESLCTTAVIL